MRISPRQASGLHVAEGRCAKAEGGREAAMGPSGSSPRQASGLQVAEGGCAKAEGGREAAVGPSGSPRGKPRGYKWKLSLRVVFGREMGNNSVGVLNILTNRGLFVK